MASRHQVLCISKQDKTNPHERITHIGGQNADGGNWKITQEEAITSIEAAKWSFFVRQRATTGAVYEADVVVATRSGRKYLKTRNDGESPDNLLSLPECA